MLTAFSPGTVICHRAAPVITVIWQPTTTSSNRKQTVPKQLQLCQAVSSAQAAAPLPRRYPCTLLHRRDTRRSFPFPSSGWAGAPPIITHHHDQQRRAAAAPCARARATHSQNGGQQQEIGTEKRCNKYLSFLLLIGWWCIATNGGAAVEIWHKPSNLNMHRDRMFNLSQLMTLFHKIFSNHIKLRLHVCSNPSYGFIYWYFFNI